MAVRAIKAGAVDFIVKPWQNEKLLATLSAALRLRQSRQEVEHLRSQQQQLKRGSGPGIPRVHRQLLPR